MENTQCLLSNGSVGRDPLEQIHYLLGSLTNIVDSVGSKFSKLANVIDYLCHNLRCRGRGNAMLNEIVKFFDRATDRPC